MTTRDGERIRARYDDHVGKIIKQFQTLPPGDVWQAFARDIQYGESSAYEEYERLLDKFCMNLLQAIGDHELELLWYGLDAWIEHDEDKPSSRLEWEEGVREELCRAVRTLAADLKLDEGKRTRTIITITIDLLSGGRR